MLDDRSANVSSSAMDRVQAAISARESTNGQSTERAESVSQSNVGVVQSNVGAVQSKVPSEEDVLGMWTTQPVEDSAEDAKAFAQVTPVR